VARVTTHVQVSWVFAVGEDGRVTRPAASDDHRARARPSLLYLVKQLELAVRARLDEVLRPVSVTPLQYTALTVLERRSDLSTAELARNAFVTDQSAADMVGVLEGRGLTLRHPDPGDRRRRVLRLTAEGQDLLDQVRADVEGVEEQMLSSLTAAEADGFRHYLRACRGALSSSPPH
jgi:DNA-binding MarR family transcriptional regulator